MLKIKGVAKYLEIMELAANGVSPTDPEFQKLFDGFYRIRRDSAWREEYYRLFDEYLTAYRKTGVCPTFGDVLEELYKRTGQVEPSFASKLLHTLNPDKPIWDKNVLAVLEAKGEISGKYSYSLPDAVKIEKAKEIYRGLEDFYARYLPTPEAKQIIAAFDAEFPSAKDISDVKKVDFNLWSSYNEMFFKKEKEGGFGIKKDLFEKVLSEHGDEINRESYERVILDAYLHFGAKGVAALRELLDAVELNMNLYNAAIAKIIANLLANSDLLEF